MPHDKSLLRVDVGNTRIDLYWRVEVIIWVNQSSTKTTTYVEMPVQILAN
jgi:hypothetical protein